MTMIDNIKRDREIGTPGPWSAVYYDAGDKDEWIDCPLIDGPEEYDAAVVHWGGFKQRFWQSAHGDQRAIDANASRIARVPDMEAALLAAEELADAVDEWKAKGRTSAASEALNAALGAFRKATEGK